ncbi:MAG TPA: type II toxin-antitoxin system prevent-host-death family antitoxin [Burkholderiaceae bacterium]|nr:type II toxin-antitoxin system prevent-host-death family antitoxin [Burkholderiaceae bacterium]
MTTIGIFEAKNRLSELVERAARGEEIVISRRGKQVARLLPLDAPDSHAAARARALAQRIRRSRQAYGSTRAPGDRASLRDLIEEGRR